MSTSRQPLGISRTLVQPSELANVVTRINHIPGISRPVQEVILVRDARQVGRIR